MEKFMGVSGSVVQEHHKDGHPHVHALLKFEKKMDIRWPDYFDYKGYHPNFETTRY